MPLVAAPDPAIRLIPSRYPPIQAFDDVASPDDLEAVMALEGWTNDRLVAQRLARLPRDEWVHGRPNASIVMAAFLHVALQGGRFNGPELGAWYAAQDFKTAVAEVAHHLRRELWNTNKQVETRQFRAYGARLDGDFEDLRGEQVRQPEIFNPSSHVHSQAYGEKCRAAHGSGIIYDNLRLAGGTNIVAYRPSKILEVRQLDHWRITASLDAAPIAQRLKI
jgi:RES domain-containing protein